MSYERRLKDLHLELPLPPQPLATYVPVVQAGDLLFLSGVLPMRDGQLAFSGLDVIPYRSSRGWRRPDSLS